jgi:hypothetical protein
LLKIRWVQRVAIAPEWRDELERKLVQRVEARYPEKVWRVPEESLRQEITTLVDRCLGWGFGSASDIVALADVAYDRRGELDLSAQWVGPILGLPQLTISTKLDLLLRRLDGQPAPQG